MPATDEKQELGPEQQRQEFLKQQQEEREKAEASAEPKVQRYRGGKLTRQGMEAAIREGGSVMIEVPISEDSPATTRVVISRIEDIPDDAILTKGDAAASKAALDALDAEAAQLGARRAALEQTHSRAVEADAARAKAPPDDAAKKAAEDEARKKAEQEEAERQAAAKHPRR